MKNMGHHIVASVLAIGAIVCIVVNQVGFVVPFIVGAAIVELYGD
jgi:hypothetical protein